MLADLKPGDFVLMQFGHNDGGPVAGEGARGSLRGGGEAVQEVADETTGKKETVHTYGWYMRKYIADARAKGATPVVLSPVPRNMWGDDGKVLRAANDYGKWAAEAAKTGDAAFIDLNELVARRYEAAGPAKVKELYFGEDHTHTTPAGARLNAEAVVEGLKGLKECPLSRFLAAAGDAKPAGTGEVAGWTLPRRRRILSSPRSPGSRVRSPGALLGALEAVSRTRKRTAAGARRATEIKPRVNVLVNPGSEGRRRN